MPSASPLKKLFAQQQTATNKLFTQSKQCKEDNAVAQSQPAESSIATVTSSPVGLVARRSCEFTHHSPACIKKATANLNTLQKQLEEWHDSIINQRKVSYFVGPALPTGGSYKTSSVSQSVSQSVCNAKFSYFPP